MKWEFDCQLEVNGVMRQVWQRPSTLFVNENFYTTTFDLGKGENRPTPRQGYWTHYGAFKQQFPQYQR